jgi:hypothetical protein
MSCMLGMMRAAIDASREDAPGQEILREGKERLHDALLSPIYRMLGIVYSRR